MIGCEHHRANCWAGLEDVIGVVDIREPFVIRIMIGPGKYSWIVDCQLVT